jgi:hypothetical protein
VKFVSILKLYDQKRYDYHDMNTNADGRISWGYGTATYSSGHFGTSDFYDDLYFSTRKETDSANKSGVMVGKCFVFDTYFGNYLSNYYDYNGLTNSTGALYWRWRICR